MPAPLVPGWCDLLTRAAALFLLREESQKKKKMSEFRVLPFRAKEKRNQMRDFKEAVVVGRGTPGPHAIRCDRARGTAKRERKKGLRQPIGGQAKPISRSKKKKRKPAKEITISRARALSIMIVARICARRLGSRVHFLLARKKN